MNITSPEAQSIAEAFMHPEGVQLGPDGMPLEYAEQLPYGDPAMATSVEGLPTTIEHDAAHMQEARNMAEFAITEARTGALEKARHSAGQEGMNVSKAVEKAEEDTRVVNARKQLETLFDTPGSAAKAEEATTLNAIKASGFETPKGAERIAHDVATNKSPLQSLKQEVTGTDKQKTVEQLAALDDRFNGRSKPMVRRVSERVRNGLRKVGISKKLNEIDSEIVHDSGVAIARTEESVAVTQQVEGEALINAFADNKPRLSQANRERIIDTYKHAGKLKQFSQAVSQRRHGGTISRTTARNAGKALGTVNART